MIEMPHRLDINFTLWSTGLAGGTRVIFEVANRLAKRGHRVTITALGGDHSWFPLNVPVNYVKSPKWLKIIKPYVRLVKKRDVRYLDLAILLNYSKLLSRLNISIDFIKPLAEAIPECDIDVATFCFTAYAVYRKGVGKGFYYVQHYEPYSLTIPIIK